MGFFLHEDAGTVGCCFGDAGTAVRAVLCLELIYQLFASFNNLFLFVLVPLIQDNIILSVHKVLLSSQ